MSIIRRINDLVYDSLDKLPYEYDDPEETDESDNTDNKEKCLYPRSSTIMYYEADDLDDEQIELLSKKIKIDRDEIDKRSETMIQEHSNISDIKIDKNKEVIIMKQNIDMVTTEEHAIMFDTSSQSCDQNDIDDDDDA